MTMLVTRWTIPFSCTAELGHMQLCVVILEKLAVLT
jgi:hypothetical protein